MVIYMNNKSDILERLKRLDEDITLLDPSADLYTCIIVGGSALVLMDKIVRSTHDIDSIVSSDRLLPLLEAYNINTNVSSYFINFPEDFKERLVPVDIQTNKIKFFTLSAEDIVVSKLCGGREKDEEDISGYELTKNLDWDLLDRLIEDVCYGLLTDYDVNILRARYKSYKEKYK